MLHQFRFLVPLLPQSELQLSPLHFYDSIIEIARYSASEPSEAEFLQGMDSFSRIRHWCVFSLFLPCLGLMVPQLGGVQVGLNGGCIFYSGGIYRGIIILAVHSGPEIQFLLQRSLHIMSPSFSRTRPSWDARPRVFRGDRCLAATPVRMSQCVRCYSTDLNCYLASFWCSSFMHGYSIINGTSSQLSWALCLTRAILNGMLTCVGCSSVDSFRRNGLASFVFDPLRAGVSEVQKSETNSSSKLGRSRLASLTVPGVTQSLPAPSSLRRNDSTTHHLPRLDTLGP